MTIAEALQQVDLEAGRTYRCRVRGLDVQLQVRSLNAQDVSAITEEDVMLDAWCQLPLADGGRLVQVRPGPMPPPDIPEIPRDEDADG